MRKLTDEQEKYLPEFLLGYKVCALWSSNDESDESCGEPLDANYGVDDIDSDCNLHMEADCREFIHRHWADLQIFNEHGKPAEYAGHDFWLTRNGHGAGFWDRFNDGEAKEAGDRLSKACGWQTDFNEIYIYVGDNEKVGVDTDSPFV